MIRVAVITGHHPYDVIAFRRMFNSLDGIEPYIQSLEEFATDTASDQYSYDAYLFYNYHGPVEDKPGEWWEGNFNEVLTKLAQSGKGIFLLHHGLGAFPNYPLWMDVVGINDRTFNWFYDQRFTVEIASADHPVVRDLEPFEITDETYTMTEPGEGSEILLTTEHKDSMRSILWSRKVGDTPVLCCALGHDVKAYSNSNFMKIIRNGLLWLAGQI